MNAPNTNFSPSFDIEHCIKNGFEVGLKKPFMGSIAAAIVLFIGNLFNFASQGCFSGIKKVDSLEDIPAIMFLLMLGLVFTTVNFCLYLFMNLGWMKLLLGVIDEFRLQLSDVFSGMNNLVKYTAAASVYYTVLVLGAIFIFIPTIYFGIKWCFYDYIIVDENAGPLACLTRSAQITANNWWKLFAFHFLLGLINIALFIPVFISVGLALALAMVNPILGVLAGLVAALLSIPVSCFAYWLTGLMRTKAYRSLNPQKVAAPLV